ncbi:hypothetical protein TRICI_004225 [Trichomonascus ciferrii]|uniref:Glucosidase II subunit alpha n=1 Tax=Trichomonascus ciferrii TaxID=44093 RepID=A0A642V2Y4_9ASCO|nr:hypothetical protein TRICI_004225 [Trichomonascus ciferrii]
MLRVLAISLFLLALLVEPILGVKSNLFKNCDQNKFCKRNRHYADRVVEAGKGWTSPYELDMSSIEQKSDSSVINGRIVKHVNDLEIDLPVTFSFLETGGVRVSVDEQQRIDGKIDVYGHDSITPNRYNISQFAFAGPLKLSNDAVFTKTDNGFKVVYENVNEMVVKASPFSVDFYRSGKKQVSLNGKGWLNYEHWRPIEGDDVKKHVGEFEIEDGFWEEEFDSFKDKKTKGPEAVAMDVTFEGYKHVYGIPEHADKFSLRETRGGEGNHQEPYRLYNVDIFEYETNSPMPMYGSIPFMQAQTKGASAGVFWANAADTYIDITKDKKSTTSHWISEAGLLDVFVFLSDTPEEINRQYGAIVGYTLLPQSFAIGYHQCRWNYNSEEDVLDITEKFDQSGTPYDVIWLDVEYTEEKKYFTWNKALFPDPVRMMNKLDQSKRKLVPIIDPHIKNADNYKVVSTFKDKGWTTKNNKGETFFGHCWPGESIWLDPFNPAAQNYWDELFSKAGGFGGGAENLHIWNDMNEPSVFDGPETSMPKDNIHYGGWEHRDIHNIHGLTFVNYTMKSLNKRYGNKQRPFILTRSFFAGSQRTGAMWTGDAMSKWEYLKISIPQILTQGVSGMPFAGSDVGGFFGDPSPELLTRWTQAGVFYPFYRAHAHIDSKRREPYMHEPPYNVTNRDAIQLRYRLLPTFYTAFHDASTKGSPVLKPLYYITPDNERVYDIDDEFFVGDSGILAMPVTDEGAKAVDIYVPDDKPYYDYDTYKVYKGEGTHVIYTPLEKIPMLMRGGHIHVRRDRHRRSAELMKHDPLTLVIALDSDGAARGKLYNDDGISYEFQNGDYVVQEFSVKGNKIQAKNSNGNDKAHTKSFGNVKFERVIIVGEKLPTKSTSATIHQAGKTWSAQISPSQNSITIRNPRMSIGQDWSIDL